MANTRVENRTFSVNGENLERPETSETMNDWSEGYVNYEPDNWRKRLADWVKSNG